MGFRRLSLLLRVWFGLGALHGLVEHARAPRSEKCNGLDLFDRLDWCVQDDRVVLDDASTGQVRT